MPVTFPKISYPNYPAKMILNVDGNLKLELISEKHAPALYEAVNSNREHLAAFLPWVDNFHSVKDFSEYINNCMQLNLQQQELSFVIIHNDKLVGRIGLHNINLQHMNAAIGYWLTRDATGQGIIGRCCKIIISYAFRALGLHRIEIRVALKNLKSSSIPEKLGFKKEGILRQAELVNGEFHDLVIYSMLSDEWDQINALHN